MAYYTDQEEQTQCCFMECESIGDRRVHDTVHGQFVSVCKEHEEELIQWIADSLT
jgi:hypothetical protein